LLENFAKNNPVKQHPLGALQDKGLL